MLFARFVPIGVIALLAGLSTTAAQAAPPCCAKSAPATKTAAVPAANGRRLTPVTQGKVNVTRVASTAKKAVSACCEADGSCGAACCCSPNAACCKAAASCCAGGGACCAR